MLQGYGLTETSPVISVNPMNNIKPESVGVPLRGVSVKIGEDDELLVKHDVGLLEQSCCYGRDNRPSRVAAYWRSGTYR